MWSSVWLMQSLQCERAFKVKIITLSHRMWRQTAHLFSEVIKPNPQVTEKTDERASGTSYTRERPLKAAAAAAATAAAAAAASNEALSTAAVNIQHKLTSADLGY